MFRINCKIDFDNYTLRHYNNLLTCTHIRNRNKNFNILLQLYSRFFTHLQSELAGEAQKIVETRTRMRERGVRQSLTTS